MLCFYHLEIENFRSFKGKHSFSFSERPVGLYQISGMNGAGKSSLIEAIYWGFYGKTTRGVKAGNINTWGEGKKTQVTVSFFVGDIFYELKRVWNPNKLTLNEEAVDQETIENIIKLNSEAFKYSILIPQFGVLFFDLQPSKKLELFSGLLDLDYWLDCSKKAQNQEKKLEREIADLREDQRYREGRVETLIEQAEEYEQRMDEFSDKKKREIQEKDGKLRELRKIVADEQKKLGPLEKEAKKHEKEIQKLQKQQEEVEDKIAPLDEQYAELEEQEKDAQREIRQLDKDIEKFTRLGDTCPNCRHEITKAHLDKHLKPLEQEKTGLEKQAEKLDEQMQALAEDVEAAYEEYNALETQISSTDELRLAVQNEIQELGVRVRDAEKSAENESEALSRLKAESNPYDAMLTDTLDKLEALNTEIEEIGGQTETLNQELNAVSYWAKGFKELRLFVVEDVLTHLEVQINNHIHDLGLEGWDIKLDVEKENKTGGVSKGFHVLISSPNSGEPVPFEVFSGGETQRLRIAGQLGLADLIFQSYGITPNLMVLDEPTDGLSVEGVQALLDLLYTKAQEEQKQIYLIDHHSHDYGGFEGVIEIQKGKKGSVIH